MEYHDLINSRSPEGQIYWEGLLEEKLLIQKFKEDNTRTKCS